MKIKLLAMITLIALLYVAAGCGTMSAKATTENITKPVIIGPVMKIKGQPQAEHGKQLILCDIRAKHSSSFSMYERVVLSEGSNKFDVELEALISEKPNADIRIHEIGIGSYSGSSWIMIVFPLAGINQNTQNTWTGIRGGLYKSLSGGNGK